MNQEKVKGEGEVIGICIPEVEQNKAALARLFGLIHKGKLMYVNVCKDVNISKIGAAKGSFKNVMPGTIMEPMTTNQGLNEFSLIAFYQVGSLISPRYIVHQPIIHVLYLLIQVFIDRLTEI